MLTRPTLFCVLLVVDKDVIYMSNEERRLWYRFITTVCTETCFLNWMHRLTFIFHFIELFYIMETIKQETV